jgi:hypothetical protein
MFITCGLNGQQKKQNLRVLLFFCFFWVPRNAIKPNLSDVSAKAGIVRQAPEQRNAGGGDPDCVMILA